jgi:plasmid stabilization system protein ParE
MRVQFTPSARTQFLAAITYIYRDSPSAAIAFRHKTEKTLSRLRKFPRSGRILPEFPDLPFREVLVPPYRFFYSIKENSAWIVAVWHSAQLPKEPHDTESIQPVVQHRR